MRRQQSGDFRVNCAMLASIHRNGNREGIIIHEISSSSSQTNFYLRSSDTRAFRQVEKTGLTLKIMGGVSLGFHYQQEERKRKFVLLISIPTVNAHKASCADERNMRLRIKIFVNVIFARGRNARRILKLPRLLLRGRKRKTHRKTERKLWDNCCERRERDAVGQTFPFIEDDFSCRMSSATFPISIRRVYKNAYRLTRVNLHV